MKSRFFLGGLALILCSSFTSKIQDGGEKLCKAYFPLKEGTIMKYEEFDHKDKLQSAEAFEVKKITTISEGLTIDVHMSLFDKKGKEELEKDITYTCENGIFKMSMDHFVDQEMMSSMEGIEVEVETTNISFPSQLSVGNKLPDAEMIVRGNGMQLIKVNVVEREVNAIETIETPAGTFTCYKISATTKTKVAFMNTTTTSVDWFADEIGPVRSEFYNKSGKLESYRVLSEIKY